MRNNRGGNQWRGKKVREPGDVRGAITSNACGSSGFFLQFGLRLGRYPRCLVATTPRPTKLIRELLAREGRNVAVTRGSTYENRARAGESVIR
jgi:hypothetical protein